VFVIETEKTREVNVDYKMLCVFENREVNVDYKEKHLIGAKNKF
jgi:hypothetical protein